MRLLLFVVRRLFLLIPTLIGVTLITFVLSPAVAATFLATCLGSPLGTVSAVRKDRLSDHVTRIVALTGYSMPLFWLALLLQIFAVRFVPSLPINGQVSPGILSGRAWLVETGVFESKPTHFLILDAALNGDGAIF